MLLLTGCSDHAQISGTVTLTDGTPVARGHVVFENDTISARGEIQPDGSFRMGTRSATDGVPRGEYTVYLTGATQVGQAVEGRIMSGGALSGLGTETVSIPSLTPVVAIEYTSGSTSPLRFTAERSATFDIVVPPNPNL